MLRGFATINFWADDLEAAKAWYTELLGIAPYFERPGYAEFRIGDYQHELGIVDRRYARRARPRTRAARWPTGRSTIFPRSGSGCWTWAPRSTSR